MYTEQCARIRVRTRFRAGAWKNERASVKELGRRCLWTGSDPVHEVVLFGEFRLEHCVQLTSSVADLSSRTALFVVGEWYLDATKTAPLVANLSSIGHQTSARSEYLRACHVQ